MSFRTSVAEEIKRSPIAAMSGAAGVVIAALSLGLAWIQFRTGTPSGAPPLPTNSYHPSEFSLANLSLLVAYFLAITVAVAILLRAIARKHDFTAFFASIPLVALTNFSAILVIYLAPPRPLSSQLFSSAHDLVFYASAAIVIAFCGRDVLIELSSTSRGSAEDSKAESSRSGQDGVAILFIALIVLAVWSWLVFAGQTRLTRTLLPEITHQAENKPAQPGPQP